MGTTTCRVVVDGDVIDDIVSFDYQSDLLTVAEEAHFAVAGSKKWRDKCKIGAKVEFIMQNAAVNGGTPTVRHRGRIVHRESVVDPAEGWVLQCTSADLGWHLQNSSAPIWISLEGKTFADLVDPATSPLFDSSWGFQTPTRFDGDIRRRLKMGLALVAVSAQRVLDPAHRIQIEPGDAAWDKIVEYAARINLCCNVSPDGYLCCYRPNDTAAPLYSLRLRDGDERNNLLRARVVEDARERYTQTEVVGDPIGWDGPVDAQSPNSQRKRGKVSHPGALPFKHALARVEPQAFQNGLAQKFAEWDYKRGMYNSFYYEVSLLEHHQNGYWFDVDNVAHVEDDLNALYGNLYVAAVRCVGSKTDGDISSLVLRMPGLLSATIEGGVPNPPVFRASSVSGKPAAAP